MAGGGWLAGAILWNRHVHANYEGLQAPVALWVYLPS